MSSAAFAYPAKSAEAFRTISEVATELDVPQHVLRFWESRFSQIRPVKRAGGRRYYRPEDVDLLKGIRALLYRDGLTIKGVQKVLKERGLRHVAEIGRGGAPVAPAPAPVVIEKIVYVEKPVAPKRPRATHLRAVPDTLALPFFDEPPTHDFPVLDKAPEPVAEVPPVVEPVAAPEPEAIIAPVVVEALPEAPVLDAPVTEDGPEAASRARLAMLLDELTGLKAQLAAARSAL